ncbi:MAG: hypothetical protein JRC69_08505 [Deltaproteobacteria bacterium]|nr:hypothetical protein [Deltaproteobacteria bacterium]
MQRSADKRMQQWKITGLIATLIIVFALPLSMFRQLHRQPSTENIEAATFVGSEACSKCHKREYEEWQESHHAKAMAVASEKSVLGDFDNATFENRGITSRFYRKNGIFFVHTQGPDGEMDDYQISHTFGWYPLQQYLIPFPGGRMQCLPIAWDDREKKWFHLYPDLEARTGTPCVPTAIPPNCRKTMIRIVTATIHAGRRSVWAARPVMGLDQIMSAGPNCRRLQGWKVLTVCLSIPVE